MKSDHLLLFSFRDAERKRKVKHLFNSLATQEGEWKALKRKKFKK
jgi:nucleolar protein 14